MSSPLIPGLPVSVRGPCVSLDPRLGSDRESKHKGPQVSSSFFPSLLSFFFFLSFFPSPSPISFPSFLRPSTSSISSVGEPFPFVPVEWGPGGTTTTHCTKDKGSESRLQTGDRGGSQFEGWFGPDWSPGFPVPRSRCGTSAQWFVGVPPSVERGL